MTGVRVEPATRDLVARFFVPRGARDVWLVCDTSRPIEIGAGDDERELGVDLASLTIVDSIGASRSIELDDARLGEGFHAPEGGHRWTSKRARIPSELFAGLDGAYLQIQLTGPALPRWSPPAGEQVEDANAHGVKAA